MNIKVGDDILFKAKVITTDGSDECQVMIESNKHYYWLNPSDIVQVLPHEKPKERFCHCAQPMAFWKDPSWWCFTCGGHLYGEQLRSAIKPPEKVGIEKLMEITGEFRYPAVCKGMSEDIWGVILQQNTKINELIEVANNLTSKKA